MRRFTSYEKAAGELAVNHMSKKAREYYNGTDPLDVYKYTGNNGNELYAYKDCEGIHEGLTFKEIQKTFEDFQNIIDDLFC